MEIQFFNILKSGNYEKFRVLTKSTFNEKRRIVVYNPFAKELWMLNGSQLDTEIIRLTDYAMDKLKKDLKVKHRIKVVDPDDSPEKFNFLLNLSKNPELGESLAETKQPTKEATKKAAKKTTKKTSKKATIKVEKEVEEVKTPEQPTKRAPLPRVESSTIPKVSLASPSTKSTMGIAKGDLHDEDGAPVQMVEEFQIAYYEASGGAKLLIEELEGTLREGVEYDKLVDHIQLINELVKSKSSNADARMQLNESIKDLADALFPITPAKTTKKVAKVKKKKATKKGVKKTTKKKTKTSKK